MALIDTLKLAHALRDRGGFSDEAAEGTAQALNEALGEGAVTKADLAEMDGRLKASLAELSGRLTAVEAKLTMVMWAVGLNAAATVAVLIKHW